MQDNLDELRDIEGFPLGEDKDLHALSDPSYYTAYPNPHITEFLEKYGTPFSIEEDDCQIEPHVADVSEGKNDPIYNAQTYHTKIPYNLNINIANAINKPIPIIEYGAAGHHSSSCSGARVV